MTIFKRGSTFTATVTYLPALGDPVDLSSTTVTSFFRDANLVPYPATVAILGRALSLTVTLPAATTQLWPLASVLWDIKFIYAGTTFYSATEQFQIVDNITP